MTNIDRREFLKASGALVVGFSMLGSAGAQTLRAPKSVAKEAADSWLTISPENRVTVYCGKVDLGTGSRTALAQLAAEELDVAFERVEMVMGDTATTPDQWLTAANLTIFQGGSELRRAAASARRALVERAAQRLSVSVDELAVDDGVVRVKSNPAQALRYGELIGDGLNVEVDPKIALKKSADYRLIGKSIRRVDIPGKVTGEFTYIHDVRVPGMLHARVIRSDLNEARIEEVDLSEARKVHGYVQTVRKKDFLAVVARSEWAAIKAARAVRVYWRPGTSLPDQGSMFDYWRRVPVA
ncbi:MAG: molybdopterin cofactor-binding domain-containing protein, partial [Burkholderiales bacterium]